MNSSYLFLEHLAFFDLTGPFWTPNQKSFPQIVSFYQVNLNLLFDFDSYHSLPHDHVPCNEYVHVHIYNNDTDNRNPWQCTQCLTQGWTCCHNNNLIIGFNLWGNRPYPFRGSKRQNAVSIAFSLLVVPISESWN